MLEQLTRLEHSDRELITMRCLRALSHAQAAARLGISPQAAKTRLFRARQLLRGAAAGAAV